MRRPAASLSLALLLAACAGEAPPAVSDAVIDAAAVDRIAGDVHFLADDLLEGREAGSRGYDLAALYVANRFRAMGLQPAGDDGGWYQRVPMLQGRRLAEGAQLRLMRDGQSVDFVFQEEFLPGVNYARESAVVTAPMVFVGQAIHAPEFDHDDFAGIDLNGKIAVVLNGAPEHFPNDPRAFHAHGREKLRNLTERGAIGVISINDPAREARMPWASSARNWQAPGMRLRDPDGQPVDTFTQLIASTSISAAAAEKLFAGAPLSAAEVFEKAKKGELAPFEMPGTATIATRSKVEPMESRNVVARLPGSDAALADEHVVFTAHLDHLGIGAEVGGDAIYNGALDNAMGVAVMLEAARIAMESGAAPKRSLLFVALTAEEKGLLGAEHFARNPSVDGTLIANVNMDMPMLLFPQRDVVPIGVEHSSLQAHVEKAASELGMTLTPDPFPEEVVFVRSDQYAFIRQGIPAVYLDGGLHATEADIDGTAMVTGFLREHYHQPTDQADLPIHYPSAARLARLNQKIGFAIANDAERPRWNEGDFFGERFGRSH